MKLLYLGVRNLRTKVVLGSAGNRAYAWTSALNAFEIHFPGRLNIG